MGFVDNFNVPPYFAPENVTIEAFSTTTRLWENIASDAGTVRVFIVQDSPEMRQHNFQWSNYWGPTDSHYDYFCLHDAHIAGNRTPTVRRLRRDDEILRASGERLQVVSTYDDFALAQLIWLTKVPARDPVQAPL